MTVPRRRWCRFSLRTVFVVVTIIGVWLGWNMNIVHNRQRLLEWSRGQHAGIWRLSDIHHELTVLRSTSGFESWEAQFENVSQVSVVRQLLGDESIAIFEFSEPPLPTQRAALQRWFPESTFDYEVGPSGEFVSYTEQSAHHPERFALPTLAPLSGKH